MTPDLAHFDEPNQTSEVASSAKPIDYEKCKERDCLRPVYRDGLCKLHADMYAYRKARK